MKESETEAAGHTIFLQYSILSSDRDVQTALIRKRSAIVVVGRRLRTAYMLAEYCKQKTACWSIGIFCAIEYRMSVALRQKGVVSETKSLILEMVVI